MAHLFIVEGRIVKPNPETLLIPPFKDIWARDKTKDKTFAMEEFTYIEFVTSMKKSNPYAGYDEKVKRDKVKDDIITKVDWGEDDLIRDAIKKIKEFQEEASVTYSYYMANKIAAEQIKTFFLNFDIGELNTRTGNPIYKPRDITGAISDANKTLETLHSMKEKVEQEIFESSRTRGQKEISPFAKI